MAKRLRYYSIDPQDVIASVQVNLMNAEVFGAYTSLYFYSFSAEGGRLPNDDESLCRLARLPLKRWLEIKKHILPLFVVDGDYILLECVSEALQNSQNRAQNAEKSESKNTPKTQNRQYIRLKHDEKSDSSFKVKVKVKEGLSNDSPSPPAAEDDGKEIDDGSSSETYQDRKAKADALARWEQFDSRYPRPGNGRNMNRKAAKQKFLKLSVDNQKRCVEAAGEYAANIQARSAHDFVQGMDTWLNQERWNDSFRIAPSSEDGKRIIAAQSMKLAEARREYEQMYSSEYAAWVEFECRRLAMDEAFVEDWRTELTQSYQKAVAMGRTTAANVIANRLYDEDAGYQDLMRKAKAAWESSDGRLSFWQWDERFSAGRWDAYAEAFKPPSIVA